MFRKPCGGHAGYGIREGGQQKWRFSLRRRMDKHAQEESDPELRQAYIDAQRQMDRGRASSHGFFG